MPKFILTAVLLAAIATALLLNHEPIFNLSGTQPDNLGIQNGQLAPCPATPNCVSSQALKDSQHYIAPIPYQSPSQIIAILNSQHRTKIIKATDNYIYAQVTSRIMGFVDDLEFYFSPTEPIIHTRSASRLGESDLGANRQRLAQIALDLDKI